MTFTLQILHASDLEGGLDAIENAANFAAIVDGLESESDAAGIPSILLSAGDNYIPGPFFNAGGDLGLSDTYEGVYNQLFGLIDISVLSPSADTNGDGVYDNDEIQAVIEGGALTFEEVYTTDVNGDGVADYFEEIDTAGGRVDIAIMNAMGFDASAVGNHEFDAGTEAFASIIGYDSEEGNPLSGGRYGTVNFLQEVDTPGAQFPYLSANLDFSGDGPLGGLFTGEIRDAASFASDLSGARVDPADPAATGPDGRDARIAPATIVDADGEKIGVVGATTQLIASITSVGDVSETSSNGSNDMDALAAVLQPVIDDLIATGLDKVVLVSHLQQFGLEQDLASKLRGVDVIIAGGSDTLNADDQDVLRDGDTADLPYPVVVTGADGKSTAIVSTDGEYSYVGRLVVTFDDDGNIDPASIDAAVSGAFATDSAGLGRVLGGSTPSLALSEAQQVGEVEDTAATGSFDIGFDPSTGTVSVTGVFRDLSSDLNPVAGSPVHVHVGEAGTNGPIVFNLDVTSADQRSGTFAGSAALDEAQVEDFLAGDFYVNLHTEANPGGELRGQILVDEVYLPLSEAQEVAETADTAATGGVKTAYDAETMSLAIGGYFQDLSGDLLPVGAEDAAGNPQSAIHIHFGDAGENGPIVFNATVTSDDQRNGTFSGAFDLTEEQAAAFLKGDYYINLHTTANPGGELRGQLEVNAAFADGATADLVRSLTGEVTGIVTALDGDIAGETEVYLNGEREDVRTQETNFGNLTADANLAAARAVDPEVAVSIKNGGGIRASIGDLISDEDGNAELLPPAANPLSGKTFGEVSELDIDNALRFDNGLSTVELTPAELKIVLEHAVAATAPGATPGQFPQVGGMAFSFDPAGTAQVLGEGSAVVTPGTRVQTVALLDADGRVAQRLIEDGEVASGAPETVKVVTLGFLATGGDGYPFAAFSEATDLGIGEQSALSDFLTANFSEDGFAAEDRPSGEDTRIQNLSERSDSLVGDAPVATGALTVSVAAEFQGEGGEGASEVVVHEDGRLYVTNGATDSIDVFDIASQSLFFSGDLTRLPDYAGVQSVAVKNGIVAVAVARDPVEAEVDGETVLVSQPGYVVLADAATGALLSTIDVGNLPDMLTFNADGAQLLVAGEGEFNADTASADNPLGTVAIIDTTDPVNATATILDFTAFDGLERIASRLGIRLQDGVPLSQDLEPEYIAISPDGSTAYVSLQENNAIATIDLGSLTVTGAFSLGSVDFSEGALDAKDDDVIDIRSFENLVGLRMADSIATYEVDGETYILTANEGDSRDFDEARVSDLIEDGLLDPSVDTTGLERLQVSTIDGDTDGDGDIDALTTFSSRSFSIFDASGNLVFDSGSEFERIIARDFPDRFNDDDGEAGQNRSDAKGPEPEAITVGEVDGRVYAFIGLERDSGVMIYDVTDPTQARFSNYIEPAFVDSTPEDEVARHAPETIAFIPADQSTSGVAQIAVAYEVSGSTVVYDLAPTEGEIILGSDEAETLTGTGGDDTIVGGGGDDVLTGGAGSDVFAFFDTEDQGADTITDFGPGDRIAIDDRVLGGASEISPRDATLEEIVSGLQQGVLGYDVASGQLSIRGEVVADLADGTRLTLDDVLLF